MKYAKLIEGEIVLASRKMATEIEGDPYVVYNPPLEMLSAYGYKPVNYTDPPDDPPQGYIYAPGWEEQADAIVQTWTLVEAPDDISDSEALKIILGGRASEEN